MPLKLGVTKPPRGYWAKVAMGMRIEKPLLGVLPDGCASKAVIRAKEEPKQVVGRTNQDQIPVLSVRETLQSCSKLITASRTELAKAEPDKYGMLDIRLRPGCLSVAVSEGQVHRTLLILETLVRQFEERGVTVVPVGDEELSRLVVGSEHVPFYIREQSKRTRRRDPISILIRPKACCPS